MRFLISRACSLLFITISLVGCSQQNNQDLLAPMLRGDMTIKGTIVDWEGNPLKDVPVELNILKIQGDNPPQIQVETEKENLNLSSPFKINRKDVSSIKIKLGAEGFNGDYWPRTFYFGYDNKEANDFLYRIPKNGEIVFESAELKIGRLQASQNLIDYNIELTSSPSGDIKAFSLENLTETYGVDRLVHATEDEWKTQGSALALDFYNDDKPTTHPILDPWGGEMTARGGFVKIVTNTEEGGFFPMDFEADGYNQIFNLAEAPDSGYSPEYLFSLDRIKPLFYEKIHRSFFYFCKFEDLYGKGKIVTYRIERDGSIVVRMRISLQPDGSRNLFGQF